MGRGRDGAVPVRSALAALSVVAVTTAVAPGAGAVIDPATPGVYITEIDAFGGTPQMVSLMPVIVGEAVSSFGDVVQLTSAADLGTLTTSSSTSTQAAVEDFFTNGGSVLMLVTAAGSDAESLLDALSRVDEIDAAFDLAVPGLRDLTDTEWMTVADDVTQVAAEIGGMAWLDPPADSVGHVVSDDAADSGGVASLGQRLTADVGADYRSVTLLSAGVVPTSGAGEARAASPGVLGLRAFVDAEEGQWINIGYEPGLVGVRSEDSPTMAAAVLFDENSVTPMYDDPLGTTIPLGPVTLGSLADRRRLTEQRTLLWIERSVRQAMLPFVFESNDQQTWIEMTAQLSALLTPVWQEGALYGDAASDAFSASCSATPDQILNGYVSCTVSLELMQPGLPVVLPFMQRMTTS